MSQTRFIKAVHGFFTAAPKWCVIGFSGYMVLTLLANILVDRRLTNYYRPNLLVLPNYILIVGSVLLVALALLAVLQASAPRAAGKRLSDRQFVGLLSLGFVLVFLVQLYIGKRIVFFTGWDVEEIYRNASEIAQSGVPQLSNPDYFSRYPNNFALVYTVALLLRLGSLLFEDAYLAAWGCCALSVCLSVYLAVLCVLKLTKSRPVTCIASILGVVLICLSPWMMIPYSDSLGIVFTAASLFSWLHCPKGFGRYFAASLFAGIGALYKPTVIILVMAMVILFGCDCVAALTEKRFRPRQAIAIFCAVALALSLSAGLNSLIRMADQTQLDENKEFTYAHYLMMGANYVSDGIYSHDDVKFSRSFETAEARKAANFQVFRERLQEMGPSGLALLALRKNISIYNNGTFGWAQEGEFYYQIPSIGGKSTQLLRSLYYSEGSESSLFQVFASVEQILWLGLLLCICFCALDNAPPRGECLISITLIGVTLFLLIFETRSRYLFIFSPLYLILGSIGLNKLASWIRLHGRTLITAGKKSGNS